MAIHLSKNFMNKELPHMSSSAMAGVFFNPTSRAALFWVHLTNSRLSGTPTCILSAQAPEVPLEPSIPVSCIVVVTAAQSG